MTWCQVIIVALVALLCVPLAIGVLLIARWSAHRAARRERQRRLLHELGR